MPDSITGTILKVTSNTIANGGNRIAIQVDDGTTQQWLSSFDLLANDIRQGGRYKITYATKPNPRDPSQPYYNLVSWEEVGGGTISNPGGNPQQSDSTSPMWTAHTDHRIAWNSAVNNAVPIVTQCFSMLAPMVAGTTALDPDKTLAENIRDYYEPAVAEVAAWIYQTICNGPPMEEGEIFEEGELP